MKLAMAHQMRDLDNSAIHDFGIPGIVLMENAGRKTVDLLVNRYGNPKGKKILPRLWVVHNFNYLCLECLVVI